MTASTHASSRTYSVIGLHYDVNFRRRVVPRSNVGRIAVTVLAAVAALGGLSARAGALELPDKSVCGADVSALRCLTVRRGFAS